MGKDELSECKGSGFSVFLALVAGAGIAATAILLAQRVKETVAPSAEQLLTRCDRAAEALDSRIPTSRA